MADEKSPDDVQSALQLLYKLEGKQFQPAQQQPQNAVPSLPALDEYSMRFGQQPEGEAAARFAQPSTMPYAEQMRNVYDTLKPSTQGTKDAAAIAASGIYGAPMDIVGLLGGAREVLKGRIPSHEEMSLPGGSQYLEQRAKEAGRLSQDPSVASQATGIIGSIFADPLAAAGKFGTLATVGIPAAAKGTNIVEKALPVVNRELTPLGFYSHAAETAASMKQADKPEAVLAWLTKQPGVKKEELMAAGILDDAGKPTADFMQQAKVDPQGLAERIRTGAPNVQETLLTYEPKEHKVHVIFDKNQNYITEFSKAEDAEKYLKELNEVDPQMQYSSREMTELIDKDSPLYGPDSYPDASTRPPGASNYRELLLQLPAKERAQEKFYTLSGDRHHVRALFDDKKFNTPEEAQAYIQKTVADIQETARQFGPEWLAENQHMIDAIANAKINENMRATGPDLNFNRGHYGPKYPNVIAHMRMQDVPDPETGTKILRIEEIQSDWAQTGRQSGFHLNDEQLDQLRARRDKADAEMEAADELRLGYYNSKGRDSAEYQAAKKDWEASVEEYNRLSRQLRIAESGMAPPSAPYVKKTEHWADLAVKRALKEAAANPEYTKMQLTAGDIQRQRWAGSPDADGVAQFYDTTLKKQLENWVKKLDPEAKVEKNLAGLSFEKAEEDFKMKFSYLENMEDDIRLKMNEIRREMENPDLTYSQKVELNEQWKVLANEELQDVVRQKMQARNEFGGMTRDEHEAALIDYQERMNEIKEERRAVEKTLADNKELEYDEVQELQARMDQLWDEYHAYKSDVETLEEEFSEHAAKFKPQTFYEVTITPKMREAINKGLPRFKQGGKVVSKLPKISDNPIVQRAIALAGGRPVNS